MVINSSIPLMRYAKKLGRTSFLLNIIESYFYDYTEWLAIIPILNHKDSLGVVEIYREVLKHLLYHETKRPDRNTWFEATDFQWTCLYSWSRAPPIPTSYHLNSKVAQNGFNPINVMNLEDCSSKIETKRRGKYSSCPYCSKFFFFLFV